MKSFMRTHLQIPVALLCATLVAGNSAQAHNFTVHQDMTDLAYQVMHAMESSKLTMATPAGVDPVKWADFLTALNVAPAKFRAMPNQLPAPKKAVCHDDATNAMTPPQTWSQGTFGNVHHPVDQEFVKGNDCGVRMIQLPDHTFQEWRTGGLFDGVDPKNRIDFTGNILGFWAGSVDDELDDSHIWARPTNFIGSSVVKKTINDAFQAGTISLFLPFVCLVDLFEGDASQCFGQTKDLADTTNVVKTLDGSIPGFADSNADQYTGMWHHIKMTGPSTNEFDDHEGFFMENAGPNASVATTDLVDLGATIGADAIGLSVNFDKSNGVSRYQIQNGGDFHQDTVMRNKSDWQVLSIAHTPFEPLDNLALFGWRDFRDNAAHPANKLGWPLHALGDATVPMHVAGTAAWGHRPFEDASQRMWRTLVQIDQKSEFGPKAGPQVSDILLKAFTWRQMILNYRTAHPEKGKDIPIRDLITQLAANTASFAESKQSGLQWPYNPDLSFAYKLDLSGSKEGSIRFYETFPNGADMYRPVLNDGIGATIAFLMSAAEVL